jgi:hypothetical protein
LLCYMTSSARNEGIEIWKCYFLSFYIYEIYSIFTNRTYQEFVIVTACGIKGFSNDFFSLVDSII